MSQELMLPWQFSDRGFYIKLKAYQLINNDFVLEIMISNLTFYKTRLTINLLTTYKGLRIR